MLFIVYPVQIEREPGSEEPAGRVHKIRMRAVRSIARQLNARIAVYAANNLRKLQLQV